MGSNLTQPSGIPYFSLYTFFSEVYTCIGNDPGPEFFVEVCLNLKNDHNNISKLQYPVDPESSLFIMSALAYQKDTLFDVSFRETMLNTVP